MTRHPHPDRMAEVYVRDKEKLVFVSYTADQPAGAIWSDEIQGWILGKEETP